MVTGFLVLLAIPSFFLNPLPAPPHDVSTTPLNVACVLPSSPRSGRISLTLDDYIEESKQLRNRAHIILWPENAVSFANPEDRNAALDRIRREVPGPYIGVTFHETVFDSTLNGPISQNGIALVSSHNLSHVPLVYIKQHLVPSEFLG
jgi:apolipoprotein N-acyltransferase